MGVTPKINTTYDYITLQMNMDCQFCWRNYETSKNELISEAA